VPHLGLHRLLPDLRLLTPLPRKVPLMRKLSLKKETLAELTIAELTGVVGAAAPTLKDCGPTLSLWCGSAYDACITARTCTL